MTVQQLRYVVAVAEAGSITEAARQLFLSQPSLSSAIKELEGEIGRPLFLRGRTGITLTREGMEFLGYARQVLRQMEVLEDRYVARRPKKIRFGVSAQHYTFAENAFVELVKEYGQERYEFYYRDCRHRHLDRRGHADPAVLSGPLQAGEHPAGPDTAGARLWDTEINCRRAPPCAGPFVVGRYKIEDILQDFWMFRR